LEHRILSEICSQNEPPRGKPRGILQFKNNPSAFIPAASGGVFPRGIKAPPVQATGGAFFSMVIGRFQDPVPE
jgi:hypothetical protein